MRMQQVALIIKFPLLTRMKQKWMLKIPFFFKTFNICSAQMSGSGVRQQIPDVLSSAQLKNLELKSLTINRTFSHRGIHTDPK